LINNNASLENLDVNGWTALHHAANIGDLSCCKLLVKSGAEVNCMSNKRRTPLHFAAQGGFVEVFRYLIKNGAKIDHLDAQ